MDAGISSSRSRYTHLALAKATQAPTPIRDRLRPLFRSVGPWVLLAGLAGCDDGEDPSRLLLEGDTRPSPTSVTQGAVNPATPQAQASNGEGSTPLSGVTAESLFLELLPDLKASCGLCHAAGAGGAPIFLAPANPYASVRAFKGIVVPNVKDSVLLTVGEATRHTGGPGLQGSLRKRVETWIAKENASVTDEFPIKSSPFNVQGGAVTWELGSLKPALEGTRVEFTVELLGDGSLVNVTRIRVLASAKSAISFVYPRIVVFRPSLGTRPHKVLALDDGDTTVQAGATSYLGSGQAVLAGLQPTDTFRIEFKAFDKAAPTTLGGGCKAVPTFRSDVAPLLSSSCVSCHGTDSSAKSAMDLSMLATDPAQACNRVLSKVDPTKVAQSNLILNPQGIGGHPRVASFSQNAFLTALTKWSSEENRP